MKTTSTSIVCGTDFGESASRASEVAAHLARRLDASLVLVHALPLSTSTFVAGEPMLIPAGFLQPSRAEVEQNADGLLASESHRLAGLSGAIVIPRLSIGPADRVLLDVADETSARFVVTGAQSFGAPARWFLGSTADRLVRRSMRPILVVRDRTDGMLAWARGERPLRVVAGIGLDESFDHSSGVLRLLLGLGPCDIHYVHVFSAVWPSHEEPSATWKTDLESTLKSTAERLIAASGLPDSAQRIHIAYGKPSRALSEFITEGGYDLTVVATHSRRLLERAMLGSVAMGVLHTSSCPVFVTPTSGDVLAAPGLDRPGRLTAT